MPTPPITDEELLESVRVYERCGYDTAAAAAQRGIAPRTMRTHLQRAEAKGIRVPRGRIATAPAHGMAIKGISTLVDADGEIKAQWVKTDRERQEQQEAFTAFAEEMAKLVDGWAKPAKPHIKDHTSELLALYPVGDPHIGAYAWAEEAGEDFDLEIATRDIQGATDRLVESAPAAETALILFLGDTFHSDNMENRTSRSGHALDVDTRWQKVLQAGARSSILMVDTALTKHKKVIVRIVIGNHDDHSAVFLALMLDAYYRKEPRVQVELSPAAHWYYRFGKVLIGSTHGDKSKWKDLAKIMAHDMPDDWGKTEYRYWHTGHVHHDRMQEDMGVIMECHRTLAAKDAWHASMGYRSGRSMKCIVYHADYGEVERHTADIRRVRDA